MSQRFNVRYFRLLILDSVLEKKWTLVKMLSALTLLFIASGLAPLLLATLLRAISDSSQSELVRMADLLPTQFSKASVHLGVLSRGIELINTWVVPRAYIARYFPLTLLLVAVFQAIADYIFQYNQQSLILYVGSRYRDKLFAAILKQPLDRLLTRSAGEWMSLVMNDITYLQSRMSDLLIGLIKDSVTVVAPMVSLYLISWKTASVLTILCAPLMFGTGKTGKRISHYAEGWQRNLAKMASAVLEIRKRFEFIRAQGGEKAELGRFESINKAYYTNIVRSIFIRSAFAPGLELLGFAGLAFIVYLIGKGYMGADLIRSGSILPFFITLGAIIKPLKNMGEQISRLHETQGIVNRSLQTFSDVQEFEAPSVKKTLSDVKELQIDRLSVRYGEGFQLIAEHMRLSAGQSAAIIGPSGGGKSTLLKALAGLYEPESWVGVPSWATVRDNSCLVSQKPFLFSGSIRENLTYGLDGISDREINETLSFVSLRNELEAKGQNLDTELDFLQSPLSGGQLQRMTIARGFLRPHSLILMDEITSAIDPAAEEMITKQVVERAKAEGRILLYVTHRLSQLEIFDQVWFCENGRLTVFQDTKEWQKSDRVQRFLDPEASS
ncbi:MAG: ABC transporter ATP-binding protein [Chitinophagaceae bacterium]|nr:ABC transporter ATP-binding protein [Oligoflexus sp.]